MSENTVLMLNAAITYGRVDEVKQLLVAEPGLAKHRNENDRCYPLDKAVDSGKLNLVKILLAAGADIDRAGYNTETPLLRAAQNACEIMDGEHAKIVKTLIAGGADVHARDGKSFTALMLAVDGRTRANLEIVKALIAAGADVNAAGKVSTVLMLASMGGSPQMVKALIAAGANVNATMHLGTPLILAAMENQGDNVAVLLESGAAASHRLPKDFENGNLAGKTALDVALEAAAIDVIPLLEAATGRAPTWPRPTIMEDDVGWGETWDTDEDQLDLIMAYRKSSATLSS